MSKIDELRVKYSKITKSSFDKFVKGDKTPTKKYLEYFLKIWSNRDENNGFLTIASLVEIVKDFDNLLPYIENKDIYIKDYQDISFLKLVIVRAEEIKEEKTFVKEEHVIVFDETDEYILLQPLTHRGSLRYGAQTKWCTAAKNEPNTFTRYTRDGLLLYLIDKKTDKPPVYKKVALTQRYSHDVFTQGLTMFNTLDNEIDVDSLFTHGWGEETVLRVMTVFNILFVKQRKIKESKDYINHFNSTISRLDFDTLVKHLELLEQSKKMDYTSVVQDQITILIEKLNNINNARFTTTKN